MLDTKIKQPADQLDYDIDFTQWITDDDEIDTATATSDDADLVVVSTVISSPIVKVWVNGGIDGTTYKVTTTITTTSGRIKQTEFKIRVRNY